jgi:hypothetical protein
MAEIGTRDWARATGGRLSISERLRLLARGLPALISRMAPRRRRQTGLDREALSGVELPERPPDSRVAREAEELCREVSSATLLNHCLRTYVWGSLLGQRDGLDRDDELLYIACMLHDLGLTERYAHRDPDMHCFAVEGAWAAERFLGELGWDETRTVRVGEAICLHINPEVGIEHGVEAHLLFRGAGYDVIGRQFGAIPRPTRESVLARHPRLDMKAEFIAAMRGESATRPGSRVRQYCRFGGFLRWIEAAPFGS